MRSDVALVRPDVALARPDFALVRSDVALVRSDVALVRPDVALVRPDVALVRPDLAGFEVGNRFAGDGAIKPTWAWLYSDGAQLMLAAADQPVVAGQHKVLFYIYIDDVAEAHASVAEAGLSPGPITTPFYAPRGEFQLVDPDGYVLMVTHT